MRRFRKPASGRIPDEGQIFQLQGSGLSTHQHLKATMRQRFSIFNVTANYTYYHGFSDQDVGQAVRFACLTTTTISIRIGGIQ